MWHEQKSLEKIEALLERSIMGRSEAASLFRRIADQIEQGGTLDESLFDLSQACGEALLRVSEAVFAPYADPFEAFIKDFEEVRETSPAARMYREIAAAAEPEWDGYADCDCDACWGRETPGGYWDEPRPYCDGCGHCVDCLGFG